MCTKDKVFSEEYMYNKIYNIAIQENYPNTYKALSYAREKHSGTYRKPSIYQKEPDMVEYITHPLTMACHAYALGIRDDITFATILLHDVCEDCGVNVNELPFDSEVQEAVALLTKHPDKGQTTKEYYEGIRKNKTASFVKVLDRCNNVSTMAQSFTKEKLEEYIGETEKYVYPLMDYVQENYSEYEEMVYNIKYQMISIIDTIKVFVFKQ